MADLREILTTLKDLGVRTAHFGPEMQLTSVTFGEGAQAESDEEDEDDGEGAHAKMARAAAAVLTGKAKSIEKAIEAQ